MLNPLIARRHAKTLARHQPFASLGALTGCLLLAACADPTASDDAGAPAAGAQTASADGWTVARTPWGDPDLRGTWPLHSVSGTPMQRRAELGERAFLTDEEYAAALERAEASAGAYDREDAESRIGGGHWRESGGPLRQTSLIVEPADGRVPPMTEAGLARAAGMKSSWSEEVFDELSDFNPLDRCITRGLPASMIPFPYNNGVEIHQSPGYVVIRLEIVHETRVIPLDDRPPLSGRIEQWLGASTGRFEGDTLVIETGNFNGLSPMVIVGPSNEPIPTSSSLHITERLTPTGPDTLRYEALVEDPEVLTAPFKLDFPWTRDETYRIYEYACHEDNTVVPNYVRATSTRFAIDQ